MIDASRSTGAWRTVAPNPMKPLPIGYIILGTYLGVWVGLVVYGMVLEVRRGIEPRSEPYEGTVLPLN